VGLGAAARLVSSQPDPHHADVRALRDRLEAGLQRVGAEVRIIGAGSPRLPNTTCAGFEGLRSEQILVALAERGLYASGGSACHSGSLEPSRVLRMMGVPRDAALGAVRFSLSRDSTPADVDRLLEVLPEILRRLESTRVSPAQCGVAGA
jgi:cysteine desulfurase